MPSWVWVRALRCSRRWGFDPQTLVLMLRAVLQASAQLPFGVRIKAQIPHFPLNRVWPHQPPMNALRSTPGRDLSILRMISLAEHPILVFVCNFGWFWAKINDFQMWSDWRQTSNASFSASRGATDLKPPRKIFYGCPLSFWFIRFTIGASKSEKKPAILFFSKKTENS